MLPRQKILSYHHLHVGPQCFFAVVGKPAISFAIKKTQPAVVGYQREGNSALVGHHKNLQTLWLGLSRTSLKFFLHLSTTAAVQSASLGVLCIDCSIKINNGNFFAGLHFYKS